MLTCVPDSSPNTFYESTHLFPTTIQLKEESLLFSTLHMRELKQRNNIGVGKAEAYSRHEMIRVRVNAIVLEMKQKIRR